MNKANAHDSKFQEKLMTASLANNHNIFVTAYQFEYKNNTD